VTNLQTLATGHLEKEEEVTRARGLFQLGGPQRPSARTTLAGSSVLSREPRRGDHIPQVTQVSAADCYRMVSDRRGPVLRRCPNHGGLSTGPKTAEGRERIRQGLLAWWARKRAAEAQS
jgi:hypothetical protein